MNIESQTTKAVRRSEGSRRVLTVWAALALGMVLSSGAQSTNNAAPTNTSNVPAFSKFVIIQQRNIFDPNRRHYETNRPTRITKTGPRVDAFALGGTMSYSKGRFAFFNGTQPQFNKVLEVGGAIAGYTVKEVAQNSVTLAAGDKEIQMNVGAQMRNQGTQGTNNWQLTGYSDAPVTADVGGDTNDASATAESSVAPKGANAQMSDVLKRLMDLRKQELK